jgi:hypothetical protein
MSLLEMQRVFCRILTDDTARLAYLANPSTFLEEFNLEERERAALAGVDVSRLKAYSSMLVNSRIDLALKALPHAKTFLPADFMQRYGPRYAREHPPAVDRTVSPMLREVRRLYTFIERLARDGAFTHERLLDALEYDMTLFSLSNDPAVYARVFAFERCVRANSGGDTALVEQRVARAPGVVLRTFTHGLIGEGAEPEAPTSAAAAPPAPVQILFHKRSDNPKTTVHQINAATRRFLDLCDGQLTLHQIAQTLSGGHTPTLDKCVGLGRSLASRLIIGAL